MCIQCCTCEAVGSRHPLVDVVALGSVGVGAVHQGAGQRGAVVLRYRRHTGPDGRRRVAGLLGQWRGHAVHHSQRRTHPPGHRRRLVGGGIAAAAARARVAGAHSAQCGGRVPLRGVGRAATPTAGGAGAVGGRGQRGGEDAGEGFGFGHHRRAVGAAG